jgi:molybdopterin synthase catalytic subunit
MILLWKTDNLVVDNLEATDKIWIYNQVEPIIEKVKSKLKIWKTK